MLQQFESFIFENQLFSKKHKILAAVSGGIDSVVMLHLLSKAGYQIAIAHCNFKLRGAESDQDEQFVVNLAKSLGLEAFTQSYETQAFAKGNGMSIQMAARKLRYDWFDELCHIHKFDYVAVAHNVNDSVETFLLNISRGTGLKGLTGIKPKNNNIVRPMLFAKRNQISDYQRINNIAYREDSSNATVKYSRNRIRHEIIPSFEVINSSFRETIAQTIQRFQKIETIYHSHIEDLKRRMFIYENGKVLIDIEHLLRLKPINSYLYELLSPYNFVKDTIDEITRTLYSDSGKQFFSTTHRLVKDRAYLIINRITHRIEKQYIIEESFERLVIQDDFGQTQFKLEIERQTRANGFKIEKSIKFAFLDCDKLKFPLMVRKWKDGDNFVPFGMNQHKKLSDFFIDNKVTIDDKEKIWLITSEDQIVWIIGMRIDDRYKISENTTNIVRFKMI